MSFEFKWPRSFSTSFYESAKTSLEQALNAGQKLSLVADRIRVVDLNLGTIPPELDLLAIEELSTLDGSFKGRFMLSYSGDALISLATNLHVNPLTQYKHALEMLATPSVLLTTAEMFVQLTLSQLRLRCVISLSFSKVNGLAMIFRDDPLESLNVSSSFDSFGVVQQFIQSEIENQLRERFRRDLPSLIHRLSQKWCADMAQQAASENHTPIVVEQVIHTPILEQGTTSDREPDDSLPYDCGGHTIEGRSRAASQSSELGSSGRQADSTEGSEAVPGRIHFFPQETMANGQYDESRQNAGHLSFDDRGKNTSFGNLSSSQSYGDMSVTPDEPSSQPSSWSSTWSRESSFISHHSSSPPRPSSSKTGLPQRVDEEPETDSPIINSLKRSTSNFATTFSKPPVAVTAQDLHRTLDTSKRQSYNVRTEQVRRDMDGMHFSTLQNAELDGTNDGEHRVPFATRKRLHRLESTTPKTTPNSSPHKSRALKGAKSRDRLRVHREDLDEYFPVTEEGSSSTTARNDSVFGTSRSQRPSLLNPDVPMLVPMTAGYLQSSQSDFPTKNSLRRTIMSSRLRELERFSASGHPSTKRQQVDKHFFTANKYT